MAAATNFPVMAAKAATNFPVMAAKAATNFPVMAAKAATNFPVMAAKAATHDKSNVIKSKMSRRWPLRGHDDSISMPKSVPRDENVIARPEGTKLGSA